MGTSIISRGDAPPVFEPSKHVFDLMTLFIEGFAVSCGRFPVCSRRDARRYPFGFQGIAIVITVIPFVADQCLRTFGHRRIKYLSSDMIGGLPFCQAHNEGPPQAVNNGVKLGIQSAFRAPDTAGYIPFLSRLEAVRCALRCVASIIKVSGGPPTALK